MPARRARRDGEDYQAMKDAHALSAARERPRKAEVVSEATPEQTDRQTLILDDFPMPAIARALSPNGRAHWTSRRSARSLVESEVCYAATVQRLRTVTVPVRLTFRYVYPDRRKRDVDNLTTGVTKAVIDVLVRGLWLAADDSEHVTDVKAVAVVEKGARRLEVVLESAGG